MTAGGDYEWNLPFDPVTNELLGPTCTAGVGTEAIYYYRFFEWQDGWSSNPPSAPVGIVGVHQDEMLALGHSLFVCEYRNSVLRLLQLGGANLDQVVAEPRIINGGANACRLDIEMSPDGQIYYSHLSEIRRLILDSDSDTLARTSSTTARTGRTPVRPIRTGRSRRTMTTATASQTPVSPTSAPTPTNTAPQTTPQTTSRLPTHGPST